METAKTAAKRAILDKLARIIQDCSKTVEGLTKLVKEVDSGQWDWLDSIKLPGFASVSITRQSNGNQFVFICEVSGAEAVEIAKSLLSDGWTVESYETGDYIVNGDKCVFIHLPPGVKPWMLLI